MADQLSIRVIANDRGGYSQLETRSRSDLAGERERATQQVHESPAKEKRLLSTAEASSSLAWRLIERQLKPCDFHRHQIKAIRVDDEIDAYMARFLRISLGMDEQAYSTVVSATFDGEKDETSQDFPEGEFIHLDQPRNGIVVKEDRDESILGIS